MTGRAALLAALIATPLAAQTKRPFVPADLDRVHTVTQPDFSPDGAWIAYTVTSSDTLRDQQDSDVWMAAWDGSRQVRLTNSAKSEHTPRFSPDGRWLAFLSPREDPHDAEQVWLLDRTGGEARRLTNLPGGVTDYDWSPDGTRLALIATDAEPEAAKDVDGKEKPKPAIVVDRYVFMRDVDGYLTTRRTHLYVADVATGRATILLPGATDEALPAWSPDGKQIAFASRQGADFDRDYDWDLWVMAADSGAAPRRLTGNDGTDAYPEWDGRPVWRPDGSAIAYLHAGPPKLIYYATQHLAVVAPSGGTPRILTKALDRNVDRPRWLPDGSALLGLVTDDRRVRLERIPLDGGKTDSLVGGPRVVEGFAVSRQGRIAATISGSARPAELYAVENGGTLRALSAHNEALLASVAFGDARELSARSRDGTDVHGFVVLPPGYEAGKRYPAVLRIHGGPVAQFQYDFDDNWQALAGAGYVVIGANPRGSSGRGEPYATAIFADWGAKDVDDVLALVDEAVKRGYADPARLGVGGWSYGGILTNYVIYQDARFKAATSGAGASNFLAGYGTDQYAVEYDLELGTPWTATATWIKLSRPFLHADRIRTPTLFLGGDGDMNVPLIHSEQMYQALRHNRVPTELIIYPGEYHGLTAPSHLRDRLERYLAWYGRWLK